MKLPIALLLAFLGLVAAAPIPSSQEFQNNVAKGLRLISLSETEFVWKTEAEKLDLLRAKTRFMDVTDTYELDIANGVFEPQVREQATFPAPSHQAAVKPILATLSTANLEKYLSTLTAFNNRYYKSATGLQASQSIAATLKSIINGASGITVKEFSHTWKQTSVIARFEGKSSGPVTILGAHLDSINQGDPMNGRAPGADDDGSGSVTLIETFRALVAAGFKPSTPVEFHFYSGEEGGLLGSQAIASSYKKAGTAVKAMLQLDMTAYTPPGGEEVFGLISDNVDSGVTAFVKQLASTYSLLPTADTKCGYACSDHASWYKNGFPSAFPFETRMGDDDPKIHSSADTTSVDGFSFNHALQFAKLATAFAYELAI